MYTVSLLMYMYDAPLLHLFQKNTNRTIAFKVN